MKTPEGAASIAIKAAIAIAIGLPIVLVAAQHTVDEMRRASREVEWRANFWEAEAARLGARVIEVERQRDIARREEAKATRTLMLSETGKLITHCSRAVDDEDILLTRRMLASIRPAAQDAADTFFAHGWTCTLDDRCSVIVEWPAFVPGASFKFLPWDITLDKAEGKRNPACDTFVNCDEDGEP